LVCLYSVDVTVQTDSEGTEKKIFFVLIGWTNFSPKNQRERTLPKQGGRGGGGLLWNPFKKCYADELLYIGSGTSASN
jgi:hypothetical protein